MPFVRNNLTENWTEIFQKKTEIVENTIVS